MKLAFPLEVARPDFEQHLRFLKDCGAEEVPIYFMEYDCPTRAMAPDEDFKRMTESMKLHLSQIKKAGLASHVLYLDFRIKPADVMAGDEAAEKWFSSLCTVCAGEGITDIGFFPNNPERAKTDGNWDKQQADSYRTMADIAASHNLRICTHINMMSGSRYDQAADIDDLFKRVGRANFGILFCFGCIALAGLDLSEAILKWKERIFVVHLRDVKGYWGKQMEEVQFGTGRIALKEAIAALRKVDYNGILHPEHFPIFASEIPIGKAPLFNHAWDRRMITTAWTLGYCRGLLG